MGRCQGRPFHDGRYDLAQSRIGQPGHEAAPRHPNFGQRHIEHQLHLLGRHFHAAGVQHEICPPQPLKVVRVEQPHHVVGDDKLVVGHVAAQREAAARVLPGRDAGQHPEAGSSLRAVEAAQGHVRAGFSHAIRQPYRHGKRLKLLLQRSIGGRAAHQQVLEAVEARGTARRQCGLELQGHKGRKIELARFIHMGKRVGVRLHDGQVHVSLQSPHQHH